MKAVSRPGGILWPEPDGFFGTFKNLWAFFPGERLRLIPLGLICGLLTPLVILSCRLNLTSYSGRHRKGIAT